MHKLFKQVSVWQLFNSPPPSLGQASFQINILLTIKIVEKLYFGQEIQIVALEHH